MKDRLLFVDDEPSIRLTLPVILDREGFDVRVASSVPEALHAIQKYEFDILLSDLNIGHPGDGFTVVSAMRRIQPQATTFILTGCPDFESALIAIRNQVDDYFLKPADPQVLIQALKQKSGLPRRPLRAVPVKKVSAIIREKRDEIADRWFSQISHLPEFAQTAITREYRIHHIQFILMEIADRIDNRSGDASQWANKIATQQTIRAEQGCTIPMLLVESAVLENIIFAVLQEHLLSVDFSALIPDINRMAEAINHYLQVSVRGRLERTLKPQPA